MKNLNYSKASGLVPAVIQDNTSMQVLMVGFMDEEAVSKTINEGRVTFYSRTRKKQWTKGETSGNFMYVEEIKTDCDDDSLLIKVKTTGPVCHRGTVSCFDESGNKGFLYRLEEIINQRIYDNVPDSYVNKLYKKGIDTVAQKVGEEAVELILEAKNSNPEALRNEAADLLFHFLILLRSKGLKLEDVEETLSKRHRGEKE
jgi:phosphoribosyl-ATP pyrophosphohydrolase/phosphoribosyl-AMP cyclohydrolase